MNESKNIFVDIVIDQILFFCLCTDDQCEPDVAVNVLESITGSLNHVGTPEDRRALLTRAQERLLDEPRAEAREVLADLRETLGIGEE